MTMINLDKLCSEELAKEIGLLDDTPEEETTKSELVAQVANMKCPKVVKDILMCDLTFHEAIDKLIEKERQAESKEEIKKLTAAIYKLCK